MKKRTRERIGLTALNVFFIAVCFVTLIPILYALSVSFSGTNSLLSSDFSFIPRDFTLDNYIAVFTGEDIMTWFGNSIVLAAATVAISLLVSVPRRTAFPAGASGPEARAPLAGAFELLPRHPQHVRVRTGFCSRWGLINHRLGLIIVYTGTMAVFSLWNMKGYFDTIPLDIEEAARIDGATDLQVVTRIVMPLAKPSVIVTALMVLIYVWNEYIYATTFMTGEANYTLAAGLYALQATEMSGSWPIFAAASIVRVPARADNLLPLPEAHDFRPDGGRCEGMNLSAVLHLPMSEYCHGTDETHIAYRLRCARGDLERVTLSYGDTACRVTPIIFTSVEMELAASDDTTTTGRWSWRANTTACITISRSAARTGTGTYYYGDVFTKSLVDDRSEYFKLPFNHRADIARVPDWVHDAWCTTFSRTASPPGRGPSPARGPNSPMTGRASAAASAARLPRGGERGVHTLHGLQLRVPKPHLRRRRISQVRHHRLHARRPLLRRGRGVPRHGGRPARQGHPRYNRRRVQPLRLALPRL